MTTGARCGVLQDPGAFAGSWCQDAPWRGLRPPHRPAINDSADPEALSRGERAAAPCASYTLQAVKGVAW